MAYAIIFDRWDEQEQAWKDDAYEIFDSPEEAEEIFRDAYGGQPENVANPRLVTIGEPIPGDWNNIASTPEDFLDAREGPGETPQGDTPSP